VAIAKLAEQATTGGSCEMRISGRPRGKPVSSFFGGLSPILAELGKEFTQSAIRMWRRHDASCPGYRHGQIDQCDPFPPPPGLANRFARSMRDLADSASKKLRRCDLVEALSGDWAGLGRSHRSRPGSVSPSPRNRGRPCPRNQRSARYSPAWCRPNSGCHSPCW
jgi:hypothetical protein